MAVLCGGQRSVAYWLVHRSGKKLLAGDEMKGRVRPIDVH